MTVEELEEENRKFRNHMRQMQEDTCRYFRSSGRNCRECQHWGTPNCVYPEKVFNSYYNRL